MPVKSVGVLAAEVRRDEERGGSRVGRYERAFTLIRPGALTWRGRRTAEAPCWREPSNGRRSVCGGTARACRVDRGLGRLTMSSSHAPRMVGTATRACRRWRRSASFVQRLLPRTGCCVDDQSRWLRDLAGDVWSSNPCVGCQPGSDAGTEVGPLKPPHGLSFQIQTRHRANFSSKVLWSVSRRDSRPCCAPSNTEDCSVDGPHRAKRREPSWFPHMMSARCDDHNAHVLCNSESTNYRLAREASRARSSRQLSAARGPAERIALVRDHFMCSARI